MIKSHGSLLTFWRFTNRIIIIIYEKGKYNSIDEVRYIMLKYRCDGDVTVDSLKVRFSTPTEPNRSCLVGVYAVTLDPCFSYME